MTAETGLHAGHCTTPRVVWAVGGPVAVDQPSGADQNLGIVSR